MDFFKPTWKKLLIAIILTIWPYVVSWLFLLHAGDTDTFTDPMDRLSFFFHSWYWSPLYLLVRLIPHAISNPFWQSNTFNYFVYPLLRFTIRYIVVCTLIYIANKLEKKHAKSIHKNSSYEKIS